MSQETDWDRQVDATRGSYSDKGRAMVSLGASGAGRACKTIGKTIDRSWFFFASAARNRGQRISRRERKQGKGTAGGVGQGKGALRKKRCKVRSGMKIRLPSYHHRRALARGGRSLELLGGVAGGRR